jgi:hypothetical protein
MLNVYYKGSAFRRNRPLHELSAHNVDSDEVAPICRRRESHRLPKLFLRSPTVSSEVIRSFDG